MRTPLVAALALLATQSASANPIPAPPEARLPGGEQKPTIARHPDPAPRLSAFDTGTKPAGPVAAPAFAVVPPWPGCDPCAALTCGPRGRSWTLWAEASYLYWWVKDGPLRFPVVTTGNPALGGLTGALGQPGTAVLYGGDGIDYGGASGIRMSVGVWCGECRQFGLEFGALILATQKGNFFATSGPTGVPPLYIPAFNALTGAEGRLVVSDPTLGFTGRVGVESETRLWGLEANGSRQVFNDRFDCRLLAGFRFLSLDEELTVTNVSTDLQLGPSTTVRDRFATENRFYGGQVGARVGVRRDIWTAGLTAKIALGWTHEEIDVAGSAAQAGSAVGPLPGGFFAQATNSGLRSRDEFAIVPEVNFRVGCHLCDRVWVFAGYDFLYWSRVARPGDQIDRVLNLTQSPVFGTGTLVGPARPAPLRNSTGFFAHGLNVGLEFRY
jgi:hypothetical protein